MWTREELKSRAVDVLQACRWPAVAVCLVMTAVSGGVSGAGGRSSGTYHSGGSNVADASIADLLKGFDAKILIAILAVAGAMILLSIAVSVFVKNPLEVGSKKFFITARQDMTGNVGEILYGFKNSYLRNVGGLVLRQIFISLWSLLLIIPGIIKSYEYSMVSYLLADFPEMTVKGAFEYSKRMTAGQKWDIFVLDLSFIPWMLLGVITCGIVYIFHVGPYVEFTKAELYAALKDELASNDAEFASLVKKDEVVYN